MRYLELYIDFFFNKNDASIEWRKSYIESKRAFHSSENRTTEIIYPTIHHVSNLPTGN